MHGSGALIRWLLDNDLVDEINLLIVPVILGQGARLFPTPARTLRFDLGALELCQLVSPELATNNQ